MKTGTLVLLLLLPLPVQAVAQPIHEADELEALTTEALGVRRALLLESRPSVWPRVSLTVVGAIELVAGAGLLVLSTSGRQSDVGGMEFITIGIPVFIAVEGAFRVLFGMLSTMRGTRDQYDVDQGVAVIDAELARRSQPKPEAQ